MGEFGTSCHEITYHTMMVLKSGGMATHILHLVTV